VRDVAEWLVSHGFQSTSDRGATARTFISVVERGAKRRYETRLAGLNALARTAWTGFRGAVAAR
jgi:hypothetical protein